MHFNQQRIRAAAAIEASAIGGTLSLSPVPARGRRNREMRQFVHHRNRGNIHSVTRVSFKRSNAALAHNNVVIAARHNVYSRRAAVLQRRMQCRRFSSIGVLIFALRATD